MPRNATKSSPTAQQLKVLEALLLGRSVTDAAKHGGVDRSTVHRWFRDDFEFKAAHNRGLSDVREAARSRLLALTEAALEVVQAALADGDVKIALELLRGNGLLTGQATAIGPTSAQAVASQATIDEILGV